MKYTKADYDRDRDALLQHEAFKRVLEYEMESAVKELSVQVLPEQIYRLQGRLQYLLEKKERRTKLESKAVSS